MIRTFRYRIKDSTPGKRLERMASAVNFVWNYCNDTQKTALRWDKKWPSGFDLNKLTTGSGKELGLHSQTVQAVCEQYAESRRQRQRPFLRYRGKRSLGWIPFKASGIKANGDSLIYAGQRLRYWHSRELPDGAKLKTGSFAQDSRGRWYISLTCEVPAVARQCGTASVGIDLGLKSLATFSDGTELPASRFYRDLEPQLAVAQRAGKKRRAAALHARIANRRRDALHKISTVVVESHGMIVVGNVSPSGLAKTRMAKSVLDSGWSSLREMLRYKAMAHGAIYIEVNEAFSTQVCSGCGRRPTSRPTGIADLGIREWTCSDCGAVHRRDVNAAKNILRLGHQTLAEGIPAL